MVRGETIIFFDFDGVIVDSLKHAVTTMRRFEPTITETEFIERFHGNIMNHPSIKKWGHKFIKHYVPGASRQPLFLGIKEVIKKLAEVHTLVIVSSGITAAIQDFLAQHQMAEHFSDVLGNDIHASKHVKMTNMLNHHNVTPDHALLVTDTLGDIREATATGIASIGVLWGFHDEATLAKGNPAALAANPDQLPQHINAILTPQPK